MDIMLKRIFELKGDAHGSTKELADALGISGNAITNWKNGTSKSYRGYAEQIAEHYNVSIEWLRGETDVRTPYKKPEKETPPIGDDERLNSVLEMYYNRPEMRILFGTLPNASPDSIIKAAMMIEEDRRKRNVDD